jgi:hypothetical protein
MRRTGGRGGIVDVQQGGALASTGGLDQRTRLGAMLLVAAALACIAALALARLPDAGAPSIAAATSRQAPQSRLATALPIGLAASASASIGASEQSFRAVRDGGALLMSGGGIHSRFTAAGLNVRVTQGTLSLSLASVGRGRQLEPVAAVAPSAAASQVLYRHGSTSESYRNGPYGLEQGFSVPQRPRGASGPLVLALALGGSLTAEQAGSQILFRARSGATALRYGELKVLDAAGRQLPGIMRIRDGVLELRIADSGARYPLTIDPFFQQGSKLTGGAETGKGRLGESVALSADGNTALIGGYGDNGETGAAWVFTRSGSSWTQQGPKLVASEEIGKGRFGTSVALSADGNTALIGGSNDSSEAGAAWVFTRTGSTWEQQGPKLTGAEETGKGRLGFRVALSGDGSTAVLGAPEDNVGVGAAWVFTRTGSTWEQQGPKLTGSEELGQGEFAAGLGLSGDGNTAVIGGGGDKGGIGAAWVFTRTGSTWEQQGPKLTGAGEVGPGHFGFNAALSEDGNTALIGAGSDNSQVGAAWVFTRTESTWEQQGSKLTGAGESGKGHFGYDVGLSADGSSALIGAVADNGEVGAAWAFTRSGSVWEPLGSKLTGAGESGAGLFGYSVALSADGITALIGGVADSSEAGAAWTFLDAPPSPPTVVSGSASAITLTSATLNATVNPNGETVTDCHFEYGTSTAYGSSAPCVPLPGSGISAVAVSAQAEGLAANTTYHYRVLASNTTGTGEGADRTFATANPPEYGRCLKLAKGVKGKYATSACTSAATAEKFGYEWASGPGPKPKFTAKMKELAPLTLETVHKAKVTCKGETATGEYTGPKTVGGVVLTFTGCELSPNKCTTAGAAAEGELVTSTLEGMLGWESKALKHPANELFPVGHSGAFLEFTCGGVLIQVRGSVLAKTGAGKMAAAETVKYAATAGKQKPERFEGGVAEVLESSFAEAPFVQTGLNLTMIKTSEEPIEINWFV